ncbi:MAG: DUF2225 domain-containing protein [Chitinispirillales bacterium]|nr:DUF2225 domain-containing protein [Chitinispirillales bacterium]
MKKNIEIPSSIFEYYIYQILSEFQIERNSPYMSVDNDTEVKRRLLILMKDIGLVNEYIKRYGYTINVKYIKEIKDRASGNAYVEPEAVQEEGEDPIFETLVNCPVCGRNKIVRYELRAKSQQMQQTVLLVPIYSGAKGYKTADYTRDAVTVCPDCLFASPDKKDFCFPSVTGKGEEKSALPSSVISDLKGKTDDRKILLAPLTKFENYFKKPRTTDVVIDSYKLAMARAQAEAWFEQPYSFFKLGSYALKIAHLQKAGKADDTETLTEALRYFEEAYRKSNCPNEDIELQCLYTIIALKIRLNDYTSANSYLTAFSKLISERNEEMKTKPNLNTNCIEKWQDKSRYLWEERENPDLFELKN